MCRFFNHPAAIVFFHACHIAVLFSTNFQSFSIFCSVYFSIVNIEPASQYFYTTNNKTKKKTDNSSIQLTVFFLRNIQSIYYPSFKPYTQLKHRIHKRFRTGCIAHGNLNQNHHQIINTPPHCNILLPQPDKYINLPFRKKAMNKDNANCS